MLKQAVNAVTTGKITDLLDIIHRPVFLLKTTFGDWFLSPSSGKERPTLLGPIDRANLCLRTTGLQRLKQHATKTFGGLGV
jgi:hypothetical protein